MENPLRELLTLQERMNRLFEESLNQNKTGENEAPEAFWSPPADVFEADQEIVLNVEIAGVEREDIGVGVNDGRLTVQGERQFAEGVGREHYHRIERPYGAFARSFELPQSIDQDQITAEYRNGVLTIRMPKRHESQSRQIKITVG